MLKPQSTWRCRWGWTAAFLHPLKKIIAERDSKLVQVTKAQKGVTRTWVVAVPLGTSNVSSWFSRVREISRNCVMRCHVGIMVAVSEIGCTTQSFLPSGFSIFPCIGLLDLLFLSWMVTALMSTVLYIRNQHPLVKLTTRYHSLLATSKPIILKKSLNSAFNQVNPLFPSFDAFQLLLHSSPLNRMTEFLNLVRCTFVPRHLGPMNKLPGVTQGGMRSCVPGLYVFT
jgi:hypothetical protein